MAASADVALGDPWSHIDTPGSRNLLLAALSAFAEHGYHRATTREIAEAAGMSPAAVYVHYQSKLRLLEVISLAGHEAIVADVQRAAGDVTDVPLRVRRTIEAFASWQARNHTLARVIQLELRELPEARFAAIQEIREGFADAFERDIRKGVRSGAFSVDDIKGTTLAALSLCIDVGRWYHPGHRHSPPQIGRLYGELVMRMLGGAAVSEPRPR